MLTDAVLGLVLAVLFCGAVAAAFVLGQWIDLHIHF